MERYPDYTRERLQRLATRMFERIYADRAPVSELSVCGPVGRIGYAAADALTEYRPARLGESFGPLWSTFWFRVRGRVPESWDGRRVDLLWNSHSEATLWLEGRSAQGLNFEPAGAEGGVRTDAVLTTRARAGQVLAFHVEMALNGIFGGERRRGDDQLLPPYRHASPFVLDQCELACFDEEAWELYHDFAVLEGLCAEHDRGLEPAWSGELLSELNRFANLYDETDRSTWAEARKILAPLFTRKNGGRPFELSALGHSHLDTAWLWPYAETVRKAERTFSSQLSYLERYPEYRFAASAAQHYAWVKEKNPELFARVKTQVEAGRFLPVGGMWVEPDCNLPSGESIARQLLYGQRFFQRELGVTCHECWVPDTFGYNAQLPQLMRLAGMKRFVTQKLSWNRFNKPHAQTFVWEGLDGSEVFTHFPFADTYNGVATVDQLREGLRGYKDHDRAHHALYLFGYGDGGGGPTPQMLETLRRAADLQGLPRTRMRSTDEFFELLEKDCTDRLRLVGELYVEYHRGTYTTQAAIKRGNRRGEEAMHDAELLSACAHRVTGHRYPAEELERLWKLLLVNQFHDVLPGSSIDLVYEDAARHHAEIQEKAAALRDAAARALFGTGGESERPPSVVSTIGFARAEVVTAPDGQPVWIEAPSYGVGRSAPAPDSVTLSRAGSDAIVLENRHLRAELSPAGDLVSLREKSTGREALSAPGNQLLVYRDLPNRYDAWELDPFHLEQERPCAPATAHRIVEEGPLRASVTFERSVGKASTMRQTVRLAAAARRLEFDTEVDWHEDHLALKVAFPVDVRAMNATYEMQFGAVERPTHFNTTYDLARFEVPGHKWSDLSEPGFGVALLSESKYGFSTHGGTMRLTLLRAPTYPDPRADRGHHRFVYAIMPHAGDWRDAGVVAEGLRFNVPVVFVPAAEPRCFFAVDAPNVVLDTVKKAEDDDGIVVRLYEAHGARGVARVTVGLPFERATFVDLLEQEVGPAEVEGGKILVPYRPFQIVTIKLA